MTDSEMHPPLDPSRRILLGPGPSDVSPRVLEALARPTLGHLDPEYLEIMDATGAMLRHVFGTDNPLTLAISGTGSAGMEAWRIGLMGTSSTRRNVLLVLAALEAILAGEDVDVPAGEALAAAAAVYG